MLQDSENFTCSVISRIFSKFTVYSSLFLIIILISIYTDYCFSNMDANQQLELYCILTLPQNSNNNTFISLSSCHLIHSRSYALDQYLQICDRPNSTRTVWRSSPWTAGTGCTVAHRSVWWCWSDLLGRSLLLEPDWNSPPENSVRRHKTWRKCFLVKYV